MQKDNFKHKRYKSTQTQKKQEKKILNKKKSNLHENKKKANKKPVIESTTEVVTNERKFIQPSSANMEIHHTTSHHSKKWKDYLFEFLMLFLAVTAGFFVENIREYYMENHRAKQFSIAC